MYVPYAREVLVLKDRIPSYLPGYTLLRGHATTTARTVEQQNVINGMKRDQYSLIFGVTMATQEKKHWPFHKNGAGRANSISWDIHLY